MTAIGLCIGGQRQSKVLFGPARKPLLLFRHPRSVRTEEGKSVESWVEENWIDFSRLRLVDHLPRLVKTLQCEAIVGKIDVGICSARRKPHVVSGHLCGFLKPPHFGVHIAQVDVSQPWVALYFLLIGLGRFIEFSGYDVFVSDVTDQLVLEVPYLGNGNYGPQTTVDQRAELPVGSRGGWSGRCLHCGCLQWPSVGGAARGGEFRQR